MRAAKIARYWHYFAAHPQKPTVAKVSLRLANSHPDSRDNQKNTKDIENEMKGGNERHAEPDHQPAHDQGADDAPYQNPMLRDRRDFEVGKDENKNKDVIDAERVLDEIAGEKIQGAIWAQHFGDDQTEAEGEKHPKQTAKRCRAHRERTVTPFKTCQVDSNG